MFAASSRPRFAATLLASALATLFAATGSAHTIDLSLNVFYSNPSNPNSGGNWELVAKSSAGSFGISGLTALLSNINGGATLEAPRGLVNGGNIAGFQLLDESFHPANPPQPAYRELIMAQLPLFPLPSGSEETYIYGVGTLTNGAPNYPGKPAGSNSIGPAFTSFTNPQDIAWATGDAFGEAAWATGARILSGTFNINVTPAFYTGMTGNVFTSVPPTNNLLGNQEAATAINTIVRTNLVAGSADYNHNGIVDAGDYVIWRKTLGAVAAPPGSGADGNGDGTVNAPDYDLWRLHFGLPNGSGSGAGLSTTTVPEPAGCVLLAIGALLAMAPRRGRLANKVNN